MKQNLNSRIQNKIVFDLISKLVIFLLAISGIAILVLLFSLILKEAVPAYKHYGLFHMYFTSNFSEEGGWGIWGALTVTLFTSIVAVLIAIPIALRTSIFLKYRMKHGNKTVRTIINVLAGVPSVVFGIFALSSLTAFTHIFGINNASTVFVGIVVLIIMIFPTLVSMISNQLDLVPKDLIESSMALGSTKTYSVYKVVKKSIRPGVHVSAIVALGRAIGETMALSMILQVSPLSNPFAHGLTDFLNSSGASLGVMIARDMFSDSSDPNHRAALFAAGIALFIVVMVLVFTISKLSKKSNLTNTNPLDFKGVKKHNYPLITFYYVALAIYVIATPIRLVRFAILKLISIFSVAWSYAKVWVTYPLDKAIYPKRDSTNNRDYFIKTSKYTPNRITDRTREFLEVASLVVILGSIFWIVIEVFVQGLPNWRKEYWVWSYYEKTPFGLVEKPGIIANTMVFTIVLVLISVVIALPFAFATAIYLSEYSKNKKTGKVIRFFLDSLGGTPSIIFGMFGIVFFRQILNLGNGGFSLMAGALTMCIVIIPTFTRSIEQVLVKIPDELRMASYSLGASKFETIRKVIIPQALPGLITGVILSAGRVIAETAPVYLTIGMLGNITLNANGSGWTMTTKILYNQIFSTDNATEMLHQSYAIASAAFILVTALILVAESINPIVQKKLISKFIIWPTKKMVKNVRGGKYA